LLAAPTTTTTTTTTTTKRVPIDKATGFDVIFMLDATVPDDIFDWMDTFTQDFVRQIDVDSGDWRVGAMTFGTKGKMDPYFQLNRYGFNDEVVDGFGRITNLPSRGKPDVAGAFDYVRQNMFKEPKGDRPFAYNNVVLITGNEKYLNSEKSYAAAEKLKDVGTNVYTIGLNIDDTDDIDEVSSKALEDFRTIINTEDGVSEVAGLYMHRMKNGKFYSLMAKTIQISECCISG
jgi:hypothetical protein